MIDQIKKAIEQIEKLPHTKQIEIAQLIQNEINWDSAFVTSQDQLSILAKEAIEEYKTGKTDDSNW